MTRMTDFNTKVKPTWCPGCGAYSYWSTLKKALAELNLEPHNTVITYDIGCTGNMADKINTYGLKTLHGRSIPIATGIKIANPELNVIATGGDGGLVEEGLQHLVWAARSNYDVTVLLNNNQIFGLTTGQPTVTTDFGIPSKTSPMGVVENPINPAQFALSSGASFVARSYGGNPSQLLKVMKKAIKHKGFAFVEVLNTCVTFNKFNTNEWFKDRVYDITEEKDYSSNNWDDAFDIADTRDEKFVTGIIYQNKKTRTYSQRISYRKETTATPVEEVKKYSIEKAMQKFI
jgi:2-oxoglutarate/2-oxoacid ferredoxin oxidoreductase subunit beta